MASRHLCGHWRANYVIIVMALAWKRILFLIRRLVLRFVRSIEKYLAAFDRFKFGRRMFWNNFLLAEM